MRVEPDPLSVSFRLDGADAARHRRRGPGRSGRRARSPARSAGSRLTLDPWSRVARLDARERLRHGVERQRAVAAAATTVRQTPSIATESPICASAAVDGASTVRRTPCAPPSRETTIPTSRINPVNTPSRRRRASRRSRGRAPRAARAHRGRPSQSSASSSLTASRPPERARRCRSPPALRRSSSFPSWRVSQWLRWVTSRSSARWESGLMDIRLEEHVGADPPGGELRQRARGA